MVIFAAQESYDCHLLPSTSKFDHRQDHRSATSPLAGAIVRAQGAMLEFLSPMLPWLHQDFQLRTPLHFWSAKPVSMVAIAVNHHCLLVALVYGAVAGNPLGR